MKHYLYSLSTCYSTIIQQQEEYYLNISFYFPRHNTHHYGTVTLYIVNFKNDFTSPTITMFSYDKDCTDIKKYLCNEIKNKQHTYDFYSPQLTKKIEKILLDENNINIIKNSLIQIYGA